MIKKLTKKQKQDYVNNPTLCPYCGWQALIISNSPWGEDFTIKVTCLKCGKFWKDVYRVVDIKEDLTQVG